MLAFVFSPVQFFERRLQTEPDWLLAWSAPWLCAMLHLVAGVVVAAKTQPVVDAFTARVGVSTEIVPMGHLFAFFSVVGYPIAYGLAVVAVIVLDVLLRDSGRASRLAEFAGLCFFTHVPYTAFMVAAAWRWQPEVVRWPSGASTADLLIVMRQFGDAVIDDPLFATARLLSYYAALWLVCLLGVVLKVVSRVSTPAAVGAVGLLLALLLARQLIGGVLPAVA